MKNIKLKILNSIRKIFTLPVFENSLAKAIRKNNFMSWFFSKMAPNPYQYKQRTFKNVEINSVKFSVDISDYLGHYLYFGFPSASYKALFQLGRPGYKIMDIGANIGYTALQLAKISSGNGAVWAFEPDPYNFKQLAINKGLNEKLPLNIFNIGLGDQRSKLKLAVNTQGNLSGNKINENATENYSWVEIYTLDEFVKAQNIPNLDLIKIDVEGFEFKVLKGAENSIKAFRPILFIELDNNHLSDQGSGAKELIMFLSKYYSSIMHAETKELISSDFNFENCHFDIIATN